MRVHGGVVESARSLPGKATVLRTGRTKGVAKQSGLCLVGDVLDQPDAVFREHCDFIQWGIASPELFRVGLNLFVTPLYWHLGLEPDCSDSFREGILFPWRAATGLNQSIHPVTSWELVNQGDWYSLPTFLSDVSGGV